MSCNSCQSKFSFFTRENACPNCNISYCNKCLKYKYRLSIDDVVKVCGPCYNKLTSKSHDIPNNVSMELSSNVASSPPMAAPIDTQYKINALDNPARPPIVMYEGVHRDSVKRGTNYADQIIVDRLRKLKYDDEQLPPPTTTEICRRLALLKDEDRGQASTSHTDIKSDHVKSESLIRQYMETLELSSINSSTENNEVRLNALRGIDPLESLEILDSDENDEETSTNKIIEKAIAEVALEAKYGDGVFKNMNIATMEEYPDDDTSCVMCDQTENLLQCIGCTGDLYCSICFKNNHDDFELKKHKTIQYKDSNRD